MVRAHDPLAVVRRRAANALRARVAGEDASAKAQRIWATPGERWFSDRDPIWWVHEDASMFSGGIRALLLQSLHPLAMAGVHAHSAFRDDPWRRVQNTSAFLAATTFGTVRHAQQAIGAVNRIHATIRGTAPDGRPYAADDPDLLLWVHVAEVESFLTSYQHYGARRLSQAESDTYVEQTAMVARRLGVTDPPLTERALRERLEAYRPHLATTPEARQAARFLLLNPPLPLLARPGYGLLAAGALATMPGWARSMLRLPRVAPVDAVVGRPLGSAATATVRWLMTDPSLAS